MWTKSGVSKLISGLRRSKHAAAGSSLVVETGFPTSLADLVVKNRARLKKSSRNNNNKHPYPHPYPTSPDPIAAPSPPPLRRAAASIAEEPPRRRRPSVDRTTAGCRPVPAAVLDARIKGRGGFLAAMLFAMAVLAVGEKRLVFRITIAAFALLILDFLGFRVLELLRPCPDARKSLDLEGRECASPVAAAASRSDSSASLLSEEIRELSAVSDRVIEVLLERRDLAAVEKGSTSPGWNSGSSAGSQAKKKKKRWKKFLPNQLRGSRKSKDANALDSGSASRSVSDFDGEEEVEGVFKGQEEEEEDEGEQSDEEVLNGEICNKVVESSIHPVRQNVCQKRPVSSRKLILFLVLLSGLVGGRVVALAVTVAWFLLTKSSDTLWRVHRVD